MLDRQGVWAQRAPRARQDRRVQPGLRGPPGAREPRALRERLVLQVRLAVWVRLVLWARPGRLAPPASELRDPWVLQVPLADRRARQVPREAMAPLDPRVRLGLREVRRDQQDPQELLGQPARPAPRDRQAPMGLQDQPGPRGELDPLGPPELQGRQVPLVLLVLLDRLALQGPPDLRVGLDRPALLEQPDPLDPLEAQVQRVPREPQARQVLLAELDPRVLQEQLAPPDLPGGPVQPDLQVLLARRVPLGPPELRARRDPRDRASRIR